MSTHAKHSTVSAPVRARWCVRARPRAVHTRAASRAASLEHLNVTEGNARLHCSHATSLLHRHQLTEFALLVLSKSNELQECAANGEQQQR
eukprot:3939786-Pleurochrysis_carterae.AAC.1